jgi:hypothetical protein
MGTAQRLAYQHILWNCFHVPTYVDEHILDFMFENITYRSLKALIGANGMKENG